MSDGKRVVEVRIPREGSEALEDKLQERRDQQQPAQAADSHELTPWERDALRLGRLRDRIKSYKADEAALKVTVHDDWPDRIPEQGQSLGIVLTEPSTGDKVTVTYVHRQDAQLFDAVEFLAELTPEQVLACTSRSFDQEKAEEAVRQGIVPAELWARYLESKDGGSYIQFTRRGGK